MGDVISIETYSAGEASGELRAILETVTESTVDGLPKFSPAVCRRLVRTIAARTYAGPIHELCHLVRIAGMLYGPDRYEELFWGNGAAKADGFRHRIESALAESGRPDRGLTVDAAAAQLTYAGGDFAVTYGRMPFLAAMMDFLVTALGYAQLDEALAPLHAHGASRATVSATANDLTRHVYAFLKAHLPPVTAQRKFRLIVSFLRKRNAGAIDPADFDDEAVLDFWVLASDRDDLGTDFKSFKTVFLAFVHAGDALRAMRDRLAIQQTLSLGGDRGAGEVDPAEVEITVAGLEERRAPIEVLRSPPANDVKFLNGPELALVELILDCGEAAASMPRSLMRALVFGAAQMRITQMLRRGAPRAELAAAVSSSAEIVPYGDQVQRVSALGEHVDRVLFATFHVLALARRDAAIVVMLGLRPALDLKPLTPLLAEHAEPGGNVHRLDAPAAGRIFLERILAQPRDCEELAMFVAEAKSAFGRISRKGFKNEPGDEDHTAAFEAAVDALFSIRRSVARSAERLTQGPSDNCGWDDQFESDSVVFVKQFRKIYGEKI